MDPNGAEARRVASPGLMHIPPRQRTSRSRSTKSTASLGCGMLVPETTGCRRRVLRRSVPFSVHGLREDCYVM